MNKKAKIGIKVFSILMIMLMIVSCSKAEADGRRSRLRAQYEAQSGMYEDPVTREISNAPEGKTPEEAFNCFFKNGSAMVTFDYDSNTCVLGNTAVGAMVATIVIDSNGLYRVCKVFDRASDDNRIETKGEKINHTCFVQYFTLPGSNNPNEIVHPLQVAGDGIPSDTNQAVYVSFPDDKDVHFQHWYAFSDVDQEGYCVFFN